MPNLRIELLRFLKLFLNFSASFLLINYTAINALEEIKDTAPAAIPASTITSARTALSAALATQLRITIPPPSHGTVNPSDTATDGNLTSLRARALRARADFGKRNASPETHCFERTCILCFKTERDLHIGSSRDYAICVTGPDICDCSTIKRVLSRADKK